MPVGPFPTFDACVAAQRRAGHSESSARKICGAIERDMKKYTIAKLDKLKKQVFGFANVSVSTEGEVITDLQDDEIHPDDLEQAAYDFCKLAFSGTGEMHTGTCKGQLIDSFYADTEKIRILLTASGVPADVVAKVEVPPRWWVGFQVDEDSFAKVLDGTFTMFSVQGKATSTPVEEAV